MRKVTMLLLALTMVLSSAGFAQPAIRVDICEGISGLHFFRPAGSSCYG